MLHIDSEYIDKEQLRVTLTPAVRGHVAEAGERHFARRRHMRPSALQLITEEVRRRKAGLNSPSQRKVADEALVILFADIDEVKHKAEDVVNRIGQEVKAIPKATGPHGSKPPKNVTRALHSKRRHDNVLRDINDLEILANPLLVCRNDGGMRDWQAEGPLKQGATTANPSAHAPTLALR